MRLGVTLAGASALAIGFASPALAAQNVNNGNAGNANAQNAIIVEPAVSMLAEADIFTRPLRPRSAQTLDYGCPGLNGEPGLTQAPATTVQFTGVNVAAGSKKFKVSGLTAADNVTAGDQVTDSNGNIPVADPIKTVNQSTGKIKLAFASNGADATDTLTVNTVPQQGEDGDTTWGNENPFNDFLLQEPSYGAGNGIQELEGTGSASVAGHSGSTDDPAGIGPVPVAPVDAARSSRAPKLTSGGDFQCLNFVAYAEDAVSDIYWTEYNGAQTDAAKCLNQIGAANISTADLKLVWNETYNTSGTPSATWNSVFGCTTSGNTHPIYAYWAQSNTGTESTWASTTGATFPTASSHWPSNQIIFQNETDSILKNAATVPVGDVLYFYSYGDFNKVCTPNASELSTNALCAGTSTTTTANALQLGTELNGITLSQTTINNQLPDLEGQSFPGDRLLYNVYSDGENPNIPVSSPATLNAISEDGFMCKPATATDIDPNTGATYRSEIDAAITANGFFPLPNLQVEDGQGDTGTSAYNSTEAGIPNPAWSDGLSASKYSANKETVSPWNFAAANVDTDNSAVNGTTYSNVENGSSTLGSQTASPTQPVGYCITETTDSSSGGQ